MRVLKVKLGWISNHLGLIAIISVLVFFPVVIIYSSAFREGFFPVEMIPHKPVLDNFAKLIDIGFFRWMANTLVISIGTVLLTLHLVCPAAYAFSRLRFTGRKFLLMFMIIAQLFPVALGMVAIYFLLIELGLSNFWGLILIYAGAGVPFYTWFLKGYMDTIPRAVDEAAVMDGASRFQIFSKIMLPLSKPVIGVISFMAFIFPYNDFLLQSVVLGPAETTLPVGLLNYAAVRGGVGYPILAAGVIIASIPILIIFIYFQKYLISGLTRGMAK